MEMSKAYFNLCRVHLEGRYGIPFPEIKMHKAYLLNAHSTEQLAGVVKHGQRR
jgi:hypothetical protein